MLVLWDLIYYTHKYFFSIFLSEQVMMCMILFLWDFNYFIFLITLLYSSTTKGKYSVKSIVEFSWYWFLRNSSCRLQGYPLLFFLFDLLTPRCVLIGGKLNSLENEWHLWGFVLGVLSQCSDTRENRRQKSVFSTFSALNRFYGGILHLNFR